MSTSDSESGALSQEEIAHQFLLPERQAKVNQLVRRIDVPQEEDVKYCICQSSDCSRFMIGCDNCNGWYHGDCIGVTQRDARNIKRFYCHLCRDRDATLKIRYKIKPKSPSDTSDVDYVQESHRHSKHTMGKKSSRRCGQCTACHRTEDCRRCDFCKDMIKYGGTNKIRQKCRLRQCLNFGIVAGGMPPKNCAIEKDVYRNKISSEERRSQKHVSSSRKKRKGYSSSSSDQDRLKVHTKRRYGRRHERSSSSHRESSDVGSERSRSRWHRPRVSDTHPQEFDTCRQCFGPGCVEAARPSSKYCSDGCSMKLARSRLLELLPAKIGQWQTTQCVAEENNQRQLESIRNQQQEARRRIQELDLRLRDLDAVVERGRGMSVDPEQESGDTEEEGEWSMYCVTCGCEISQKSALRHMERCFTKFEAQTSFGSIYKTRIEGTSMFCDFYNVQNKMYCKRLKALCPEHSKEPKIRQDEVCGCPLMSAAFEETGELCQVSKRKCNRHYSWEKLRRAEIDRQRVTQWLKLDELFEQERNIRLVMSNRMGVLGLLLHQTIDHDPLNSIRSNVTSAVS